MQRAAALAQSPAGNMVLDVRDTGGDPARAAGEAQAAVAEGAAMLLGPVTAPEVVAVEQVSGSVPVIAFSNDPALIGGGAYVFGVTPVQSVAAVLTEAREQGHESVAALAPDGAYGDAVAEAVELLAPRAGLQLSGVLRSVPGDAGLNAQLSALSPQPEAILIAHTGDGLAAIIAEVRRGSDAQLLGTVQWLRGDTLRNPLLEGAIVAAADPDRFGEFTAAYGQAYGAAPGLLAALSFDAVRLAQSVTAGGGAPGPQLHRSGGFRGITGDYRLYPSGLCERQLAALEVGADGSLNKPAPSSSAAS